MALSLFPSCSLQRNCSSCSHSHVLSSFSPVPILLSWIYFLFSASVCTSFSFYVCMGGRAGRGHMHVYKGVHRSMGASTQVEARGWLNYSQRRLATKLPGSSCSCLPQTGIKRHIHPSSGFPHYLGIGNFNSGLQVNMTIMPETEQFYQIPSLFLLLQTWN